MKSARLCLAAAGLAAAIVFAAPSLQGSEHFGKPIDSAAPKVTLDQLVAKPLAYEGKKVVVEGRFAGPCGDGDFYFRDRKTTIEVDPPQGKAKEVNALKKETPIRVFGLVRMVTKDLEEKSDRRKKEGKAEEHEEAEAPVKIIAEGIEVMAR